MRRFEKVLSGAINAEALLDAIPFNEDQIGQAAVTQTPLFMEAAKLRVQLMRQRQGLEARLKQNMAMLSASIRKQVREAGDKITEGAVKVRIDKHPDIIAIQEQLDEATVEEEFGKLILEGLRQRKSSIDAVIDTKKLEAQLGIHYEARIQEQDHRATVAEIRDRMKKRYPKGSGI